MNQSELDWLFARQRFGVRPGLERVRELLSRLGDPQDTFDVVLVGGTNGKGSVAASLSAMLHAAGRRPGLFTSPHLTRFSERFRVAEEDLPPEVVDRALAEVRPHAEATGATFFEIVTALGALLFARAGVDVAVMEVGLGGRLDATNALEPVLSVVTNIGLDHTEVLGDTVQAIAAEKAGILRPGRPALLGAVPEVWPVFEEAGADLWRLGQEVQVHEWRGSWDGGQLEVSFPGGSQRLLTPLLGRHGGENAALAAVAARRLGLPVDAVERGAARTRWPGRLEGLPWAGGRVLLDGAHNPDGARALVRALQELGAGEMPVVFGAAADKDVSAVAEALAPMTRHAILTRAVLSPRAADPAELAALFPGRPVTVTSSPAEALAALRDLGAPLALVCGSLYLIGEVRPLLLGEQDEARERWQ